MGFLDSILKKKSAPEEGADVSTEPVETPAPAGPKPNPLAKLKGVLDHLEKIVLGLVLVAVTALSVLKLLAAKKELTVIGEGDQDSVTLGGRMLEAAEESPTNLTELIRKSREQPDAIDLSGSNHLVFNPRVWKEIFLADRGEALLIMDSPDEPLGISALEVTNIRPLTATFMARAYPQVNTVQYEFAFVDLEYPALPYAMMGANPLATFMPQTPMSAQYAARLRSQQSGWQPDPDPAKPPRPLHGFTGNNAGWLRFNPDWEFLVKFKSASMVPQNVVLSTPAGSTISNVIHELDLIVGTGGLVTPYETNSVRLLSGVPHTFNRGFEADLKYETKYHKPPLALARFREGRRLMIDGEVFRVFRITADTVSLVSDPEYGGNGKIYDKRLQRGAAPAGP